MEEIKSLPLEESTDEFFIQRESNYKRKLIISFYSLSILFFIFCIFWEIYINNRTYQKTESCCLGNFRTVVNNSCCGYTDVSLGHLYACIPFSQKYYNCEGDRNISIIILIIESLLLSLLSIIFIKNYGLTGISITIPALLFTFSVCGFWMVRFISNCDSFCQAPVMY